MNIGDKVKYKDIYDEPGVGVIMDVYSSMPFYEDMKLEDGVPYYISKKLNSYVAVKPKNMDTVFLIIKNNRGRSEFFSLDEVTVYE